MTDEEFKKKLADLTRLHKNWNRSPLTDWEMSQSIIARDKFARAVGELFPIMLKLLEDAQADPMFASDAEKDVDYWRLKAREHWDAFQGCYDELKELKEKYNRENVDGAT